MKKGARKDAGAGSPHSSGVCKRKPEGKKSAVASSHLAPAAASLTAGSVATKAATKEGRHAKAVVKQSDEGGMASSTYIMGRWLFLQGLLAVYLVAFASFYAQIPGLWGHEGILPADVYIEKGGDQLRQLPSLLWYMIPYMTVDTALHVLALTGITIAATALLFGLTSSIIFAALYLLYLSVFQVGQTFLSFQWDILLLEAGALAILVAPFYSHDRYALDVQPSPLSTFMVRWLLFRLMFLSGIVKLISGCPTWWGLTALHYHYQTQCIPGPLAWYAHHLPDAIQRFSVAATFAIEILCPFWIFVPDRLVQNVAGLLQILLQMLIILTGNYTFFNWLTIVLCLPLLDDRFLSCILILPSETKRKLVGNSKATRCNQAACWISWALMILVISATGFVCWHAFDVDWEHVLDGSAPDLENANPAIKLSFSKQEWAQFLHFATPLSIAAGSLFFAVNALKQLWALLVCAFKPQVPTQKKVEKKSAKQKGKDNQARGVVAFITSLLSFGYGVLVILALSGLFLATLVPYTARADRQTMEHLPAVAEVCYTRTTNWHITSSYGLFASMTTTRPEIKVEGTLDGKTWKTYLFKYKPELPSVAPPLAAPHQPRLDWQMWFAALSSYNRSPWFVNFLVRLMDNSRPVIDLLANDPFPSRPPLAIRSTLQNYEFTKPINGSLLSELHHEAELLLGLKPRPTQSSGEADLGKHWWTSAGERSEYLTLTPQMKAQIEKYIGQAGWSVHVDKLTYVHEWEPVLVDDLHRIFKQHIAAFVISVVGLALLPTAALWSKVARR